MTKIKKSVRFLSAMLAMLALVCLSLVSFTACSDDDEPVAEVTYSWEFEEVEASTPDFMDDKNKIESTFKAALGASGSAASVTKQGTSETCDREVLEACRQAFESLKDEVWQGRYVFVVTNVTTGTVIFIHTFNAYNENGGTYTTSDLKIGDYFYSDGTWSDGGLREIKGDGTMVWAEPAPQPKIGKTVIGIVFYAGHHPDDKSDYSKSGIGQAQCHGYVVTLTNVNNNYYDRHSWGWRLKYNPVVGASTSKTDWNGYYNYIKIREFVNKNEGLENGEWGMNHFPAAFACETYGNRTVDKFARPTGDYDWQKPLAAPDNTSGWFLPSLGQLLHLQKNRSFLESHIEVVRDNTPDGSSYKKYINAFKVPDNALFYWSSTEAEDSYGPDNAWIVVFDSGIAGPMKKDFAIGYVRAILAF